MAVFCGLSHVVDNLADNLLFIQIFVYLFSCIHDSLYKVDRGIRATSHTGTYIVLLFFYELFWSSLITNHASANKHLYFKASVTDAASGHDDLLHHCHSVLNLFADYTGECLCSFAQATANKRCTIYSDIVACLCFYSFYLQIDSP